MAVSQLSREVEKREDKRPRLSDLKDTGELEADPDMVWFLFRPEAYEIDKKKESERAELILAKQRNGPTGIIPLTFQRIYATFLEEF